MNGYVNAVQQAAPLLHNYGGPVGVLGKAIGLGRDEVEVGAPWWAWFGLGTLFGGVAVYSLRHHIGRIVE